MYRNAADPVRPAARFPAVTPSVRPCSGHRPWPEDLVVPNLKRSSSCRQPAGIVAGVTKARFDGLYTLNVKTDATLSSPEQQTVRKAVQMTVAGQLNEALPLFESHLAKLAKGSPSDQRVATAAFSYFGVCLAAIHHKYAEAVQYCEISLRVNPLDPEHRTNLALVYLERDELARAFECLNAGLRLDRKNRRLNSVLDRLGRRQQPVVPFLSRQNPINIWLGRRRAEIGRSPHKSVRTA